jgi:hypothetical protein
VPATSRIQNLSRTEAAGRRPPDASVALGIPTDPYPPGSWGPDEGARLTQGFGGWHGPWLES